MKSMIVRCTRSKPLFATLSVLVAVGLAASAEGLFSAEPARLPPMPSFELKRLDGSGFSSQSLAGKVVLIDLWATWCKPCVEDIPHWNRLQQRYHQQGFTLLGITVQSGWVSDIQEEIEEYDFKIEYPVVVGNEEIEEAFGVEGFPTAFLVTRDGKIYQKYTGQYPKRRAEIEADIEKLLWQKE